MSMGLDEWDLPSDADMLRWIARKQATLMPVPHCGWQVIVGYNLTEHLSQNVVVGRGATAYEALEAAMRAEVQS